MIPEKRFSTTPVIAPFNSADALPMRKLRDYEQGGTAIGDPTDGMNVQPWEAYMLGNEVRVRPYPDGTPFICFTEKKIQNIRLAFDQNMRPVIAYTADNLVKLWWYDPVKHKMVFTSYPTARDPILTLDDKREGMKDFSDVLFFYMKKSDPLGPYLYMRAQRDRYGVEYTIGSFPEGTTTLVLAGMTANSRIKFNVLGKWRRYFEDRRDIPPYPPDVPVTPGLNLVFTGDNWVRPYAPIGGGYAPLKFHFELYEPPISDAL